MKNLSLPSALLGAVLALAIALSYDHFRPGEQNNGDGTKSADEPLYWVAPMDASYRRDKPGKSPMGMDLVPVYASAPAAAGVVSITPEVINNLGVRTAPVSLTTLQPEIQTVGYLRYDENKLFHIHPRVEGWIEQLYVKAEGDPVAAQQPLYELYSPQLVNAQEEYLLALARGDQALVLATEARLAALEIADSFVAQLKKSRKVKQTVTFYAPSDGVIDKLNIREGFYVQPGTTLMSIGNLADIWLEAAVFEQQANLLKVGQQATMTLDYFPGQQWRGKIDYIYPTLDNTTRTARVRIRLNNSQRELKPNMFARVVIDIPSAQQTLTVPKNAVIRTGDQDRLVLALGDGKFKSVAVRLGHMDAAHAEILEGVQEGDQVVVAAQFLLDSESSKTADFDRMTPTKPEQVWVDATIDSVMADMGMLKVTHQPIPEWDWPVMTMMFPVADGVDVDALTPGETVKIRVTQTGETDWIISDVQAHSGGEQ